MSSSEQISEIVETISFFILAVILFIVSLLPDRRANGVPKERADWILANYRQWKIMAWCFAWGAFAISAFVGLVLLNQTIETRADGFTDQYGRWIGYTIAFAAMGYGIQTYYDVDPFGRLCGCIFLVVAGGSGIGSGLSSATENWAYWGALGGAFLIIFAVWVLVFKRGIYLRFIHLMPMVSFILFAFLLWVTMWIGVEVASIITTLVTYILYFIFGFLLVLVTVVVMWIWYYRRQFKQEPHERTKTANDVRAMGVPLEKMSGKRFIG